MLSNRSLATEEQAKLAIKMLNKTKQYVANEYRHRKQTNNLSNSTKEKDKRYKKPVEEKQLRETKTCYASTYLSPMKNISDISYILLIYLIYQKKS